MSINKWKGLLFAGEQTTQGEETVAQQHQGDQTAGEGVFRDRQGEDVYSGETQKDAQGKESESPHPAHAAARFQVFTFLTDLVAPAQDVVTLAEPGEKPGVFHHAGVAVHAMGIGLTVGEAAIEAKPVVLPVAEGNGLFSGLVHVVSPCRMPPLRNSSEPANLFAYNGYKLQFYTL